MMSNSFDAKALALKAEQLGPSRLAETGIAAAKRKRRKREFAQITREQVNRLRGAASATITVFHFLLLIDWRSPGKPILLANGGLEQIGISRWAKYRALSELEELGLIELRNRGRKSPEVVIVQL
jgi:hypothetical protein